MKKLIAGVVLGLGLVTSAYGAGDPEAGKANAAVCAGCHGQGGQQPVMGEYPKLSGLGAVYIHRQLVNIQSGKRNVAQMAGILNGKSDQDLQDLAAYFDSQDMIIGKADPDLVDAGQKLFRGGNMASGVPACAGCHNPHGLGNGPAGFPRLSGQNPAYVVKQLKAYRSGERSTGAQSQIMMNVAARLTDAEIEAVASYVTGLH